MTQNLMPDKPSSLITDKKILEIATRMCTSENFDNLLHYSEKAREISREEGVALCDCRKIWANMKNDGMDISAHLSNFINHPSREKHFIFAKELFDIITKEQT